MSAEDVQSSFYYVHVDQPDDEQYVQSIRDSAVAWQGPEGGRKAETVAPTEAPIQRKPLPSTALRDSDRPPHLQQQSSRLSSTVQQQKAPLPLSPRRDFLNRSNIDASTASKYAAPVTAVHRRPHSAGTTSFGPGDRLIGLTGSRFQGSENIKPGPRTAPAIPPPLPRRRNMPSEGGLRQDSLGAELETGDGRIGADNFPPRTLSGNSELLGGGPPARTGQVPVRMGSSITLIRRDPTSGAQWNVARIQDAMVDAHPEVISRPGGAYPAGRQAAPVYIDILNPGYSKFLSDNEEDQLSHTRDDRRSLDSISQRFGESVRSHLGKATPHSFRRQLWIEGLNAPHGGHGHRKSSSVGASYDAGPFGGSEQHRGIVSDGPGAARASDSSEASSLQPNPFMTEKQRAVGKGFIFASPWDGRCEFSTNVTGKSLKVTIGPYR